MGGREQITQRNLLVAKVLFFATAMSSVGWNRFQNNFYLDAGLTSHEIGTLKSIGLMLKIVGEPFWSMIADLTDEKAVFGLCMVMQVSTMELLRFSHPLTYNMIFLVKILRTTTAPTNTLTNTNSFKLTEGSNEGYGQQRVFGSLAWGSGAVIAGYLIDEFGMNAVFYYTYFFNAITLFFIIYVLPSSIGSHNSNSSHSNHTSEKHSLDDSEVGMITGKPGENDICGLKNRSRSRSYSNDSSAGATSTYGSSSSSSSTWRQRLLETGHQQAGVYANEAYVFISHPTCRALLVNAFLYGMVMTVPDTFLFISLEKDFGASRTYSGIVTTSSVLGCIPLFWYSTHYIAKYGHFNIIFMSQCSCVIRLFSYALLSPSWPLSLYVLPVVQLIHGLNFALYWAAAVDAIHKLSPKELNTTSMAALNVAYATFGAAVGSLLWGYVYDSYGGVNSVYKYSALLLMGTIVVLYSSRSLLNSSNFSHLASEIGSKAMGSAVSSMHTHVPIASPHIHKEKDQENLTL